MTLPWSTKCFTIVKNEQVNSAYVSKLKNLKVSAKSSNFISILDKNKYLEGKKLNISLLMI